MSSRIDIDPLSITDGKISNQAKIKATKLAPASEGQVLIAGTDGKFRPGDLPTTSTTTTVVSASEDPLPRDSIKIGNGIIKDGYIKISDSEPNSIPIRDSHGVLKADLVVGDVKGTVSQADTAATADNATNADDATLLNGNNMDYYRNVANHVAETETTSTDSNSNETTHKKTPHKVFEFDVPSDSGSYCAAGTSNSNYPIEFTHNCGYIPDVSVYYKSNNAQASDPWEEVDAEVQNTTTITKVQISAQNAHLKIVAK